MSKTSHDQETVKRFWKTSWDFFTGGSGSKSGTITGLMETGCTLRTTETIEYRRWIRLMILDSRTNVSIVAVGRVVRCEHSFEAPTPAEISLYRYRVEFTLPVPLAPFVNQVSTESVA